MSLLSTSGLARASARHPWRVISVWVVIIALAIVSASGLGDALTTSSNFTGDPESQIGADLLENRLRGENPATESIVVRSESLTVDDAEFKAVVDETAADIASMSDVVVSVSTYYQALEAGNPAAAQLVSVDRQATIIPVTLAGSFEDATDNADAYLEAVAEHGTASVEVMTVGTISIGEAYNTISEEDLSKAEMYSLPLTILILIVVFGALVAVGVPLALAIVSIIVAIGLTAVLGRFTQLSV